MKKVLALAAVLLLAACGKKKAQTPAADSTTAAPAPADSGGHAVRHAWPGTPRDSM